MPAKKLPKVSIVIYYNEDRGWLNDAIQSVYRQTYGGKIELIESFDPDKNASENLNAGIQEATGKYLKYFSEDDELTANCIEDSVRAMEKQKCDFLHGNAINRFPAHDKMHVPPKTHPTLKELAEWCFIHGGTMFYKNSLFKKDGFKFDEKLWCAEEYDLHLNMLKSGKKIGYCDKTLFIYRRHERQKSLGINADQKKRQAQVKMIQKRYV